MAVKDVGQSSFQSFIEIHALQSTRDADGDRKRLSTDRAVKKTVSQNWLFEEAQIRKDQGTGQETNSNGSNNKWLAQYGELTSDSTPDNKLGTLQAQLDRLDELTVIQLRTLRRDVAKMLHPDRADIYETGETLAEINASLDAAISRTLHSEGK